MQVASVTLHNFKRFEDVSIDLRNRAIDEVASRWLILGDNGTGKTTVLQAVALCLYLATRPSGTVETFDWLGWLPGRYRRWGTPSVDLEVHFTEDEILATDEAARLWWDRLPKEKRTREFVGPGHNRVVRLRLEGERLSNTLSEIAQFRGRSYASYMLRTGDRRARDLFERLPGVFWFDQFRNLATPPGTRERERGEEIDEEPSGRIAFDVGVARLREHLNRWKLQRLSVGPRLDQPDFLRELENHYKRLFPGRSFSDPEPIFRGGVPTPADYFFTISDGHRTYDIQEMSAGEQSVFPILFEFVRQRIRNSVVLIDEIDLNLHPPLAQAFLSSLPQLGPRCQFIFTTHSEAVSGMVGPEEVHRLEGGRLCL